MILTSFVELFFSPFHKCLIGTATLKNVIRLFPGIVGSLCHLGREKKKKPGDFIYSTTCGHFGGWLKKINKPKNISPHVCMETVNESEWRKERDTERERRMWEAYKTERSQHALSWGSDGSGLELVGSVRALCPNPFSLAFFIFPRCISFTREKPFPSPIRAAVQDKMAPAGHISHGYLALHQHVF